MGKTIVHVNRHFIAANEKDGGDRPVYSVEPRGRTTYAHGVKITGHVTLVDPREGDRLSCGATVWMGADGDAALVDPCSDSDAAAA